MKKEMLKIAIADPSVIIRSGIAAVLKRMSSFRIQAFELGSMDAMHLCLRSHHPDVLMINPSFWGAVDLQKLKDDGGGQVKCMAIINTAVDDSLLRSYDERIGMYDSVEQLSLKLEKLFSVDDEEVVEDSDVLSVREKEIVVAVVKGMTNKEIAEQLFLSAHTVISHRRNISRKLEIHSTAGLTIYAIVNKLIELDDVKNMAL